ncbi:hypothetical protein KC902_03630 [Candidatus Kaiserbacteria bacterium]|nr:hypothetical protein [Candidatus Kaiserbacteria bacterium]USN89209.1 MAG: hypothetical protein H6780_02215 [Candidatus Nomurabacteria bacterium]
MNINTSQGIKDRIEVLTQEHAALKRRLEGMPPGFLSTELKRQKLAKKDAILLLEQKLEEQLLVEKAEAEAAEVIVIEVPGEDDERVLARMIAEAA